MESAAPPRASPSSLVRMSPGQSERLVEMRRDVDCLLPGGSVAHQKDLLRLQNVLQPFQFVDQGFIDLQPAGGVENLDVARLAFRPKQATPDPP